jgi:hypothetical protein
MISGMARVSKTRIYARREADGRQLIVYAMNLKADSDVAMVLPLPVVLGSGEDAVRFIDLEAYPTFFEDLEGGFPDFSDGWGLDVPAALRLGGTPRLAVVQVGCLEASYVPTIADFARLDPRFRMPDGTWDKLPAYRDFGFAVFKLKPGATHVHPMAFSFPSRLGADVFFPTVHVHDGLVHDTADFDHTLYAQTPPDVAPDTRIWRQSVAPITDCATIDDSADLLGNFLSRHERGPFPMDVTRARGVVLAGAYCYRHELRGQYPNRDAMLLSPALRRIEIPLPRPTPRS